MIEIVVDVILSVNEDGQLVVGLCRRDGVHPPIEPRTADRRSSLDIARQVILSREDAAEQVRRLAEEQARRTGS